MNLQCEQKVKERKNLNWKIFFIFSHRYRPFLPKRTLSRWNFSSFFTHEKWSQRENSVEKGQKLKDLTRRMTTKFKGTWNLVMRKFESKVFLSFSSRNIRMLSLKRKVGWYWIFWSIFLLVLLKNFVASWRDGWREVFFEAITFHKFNNMTHEFSIIQLWESDDKRE